MKMRKMENPVRIRNLTTARKRNGSGVGRMLGSLEKAPLVD